MSQPERWSVSWQGGDGRLVAREPAGPEVEAAASDLLAWYNEEHNRAMMASQERMNLGDVREQFDGAQEDRRSFLLYADGHLLGDADLRHIDAATRTAEFAIMIGERKVQGRGYGTRFALMLHALAFEALGLERIYVTIIPANRGSLRLFEKLGYRADDSPAARSYVDEQDDVTMSFGRDEFRKLHGETVRQLAIGCIPADDPARDAPAAKP
ncbi:MAG: GNAT family N-acetyltransferase [Deltaproteobacteria bacterium]|nr:GNAT family N-acetyltransferase [Deltaproteobacteria bacterium]